MVFVKPFYGFRYNKEKVDIQDVITPPYDVIDKELKKTLAARSPYSFVNIIINKDHSKANELLNEFIHNDIIRKDDEESLYIYEQKYKINGKPYIRTGFVTLLKLEPLGTNVLPHERTFKKYVNDRYELMTKTKSDFGQIFMIYEDDKRVIDELLEKNKSDDGSLQYIDDEGCVHRLWKVSDQDTIIEITSLMKDKQLLIADGHHRYTTALKYQEEHPEKEYVMTTLVNAYNEGLVILPTNRIIKKRINIDDFKDHFYIEELDSFDFRLEEKTFVIANTEKTYKIKLKDKGNIDLDIIILHKLVFNEILNLNDEELIYPTLEFVKGNDQTIERISEGKTAFFVKPPSLKETFSIAKSGEVMPQKSTFFYPKFFAGFVSNRW